MTKQDIQHKLEEVHDLTSRGDGENKLSVRVRIIILVRDTKLLVNPGILRNFLKVK